MGTVLAGIARPFYVGGRPISWSSSHLLTFYGRAIHFPSGGTAGRYDVETGGQLAIRGETRPQPILQDLTNRRLRKESGGGCVGRRLRHLTILPGSPFLESCVSLSVVREC